MFPWISGAEFNEGITRKEVYEWLGILIKF
jgi:hypothetical protein